MTINAIQELEELGYVFQLSESRIIFRCQKKMVDSVMVKPLLDRIRANKDKAIEFLRRRQPDEMVPVEQIHDWLEAHHARIVGPSWVDKDGAITVHVEDR